ncbi:hypothetical protein B0H14DRAFT_2611827 [Mycena olivaceomarginata]|nr:hypothetical protein B0H14DRAFT_2611827 [Mycena olivaceomarginata]
MKLHLGVFAAGLAGSLGQALVIEQVLRLGRRRDSSGRRGTAVGRPGRGTVQCLPPGLDVEALADLEEPSAFVVDEGAGWVLRVGRVDEPGRRAPDSEPDSSPAASSASPTFRTNPEQRGAVKFVDRVWVVFGGLDGRVDRERVGEVFRERSCSGDDRPQEHFQFGGGIGKTVAEVALKRRVRKK